MLDRAVLGDLPWMHDALCAEPDYNPAAWFPSNHRDLSAAKAVCEQCSAQNACLAYAVRENIRYGIWGGATPAERKPKRRIVATRTRGVADLSR